MSKKKRLIIQVEGGLVTDVQTDIKGVEVVLIDHDTLSNSDDEDFPVRDADGHESMASLQVLGTDPITVKMPKFETWLKSHKLD